jgi:hypothetical protein
MTITLKSIWGHTERPWGFEVRVDFTDDSGAIHNEVMTFPKEPEQKELDDAVASLKVSVESRIALEVVEKAKPPEPTEVEILTAKVTKLESDKAVLVKEVADLKAGKVVK